MISKLCEGCFHEISCEECIIFLTKQKEILHNTVSTLKEKTKKHIN